MLGTTKGKIGVVCQGEWIHLVAALEVKELSVMREHSFGL